MPDHGEEMRRLMRLIESSQQPEDDEEDLIGMARDKRRADMDRQLWPLFNRFTNLVNAGASYQEDPPFSFIQLTFHGGFQPEDCYMLVLLEHGRPAGQVALCPMAHDPTPHAWKDKWDDNHGQRNHIAQLIAPGAGIRLGSVDEKTGLRDGDTDAQFRDFDIEVGSLLDRAREWIPRSDEEEAEFNDWARSRWPVWKGPHG